MLLLWDISSASFWQLSFLNLVHSSFLPFSLLTCKETVQGHLLACWFISISNAKPVRTQRFQHRYDISRILLENPMRANQNLRFCFLVCTRAQKQWHRIKHENASYFHADAILVYCFAGGLSWLNGALHIQQAFEFINLTSANWGKL